MAGIGGGATYYFMPANVYITGAAGVGRLSTDGGSSDAGVVLNAALGFVQESKAEQSMAALKRMSVPTVRVRRGGELKELSARALVPGDLVVLETGNVVPADGRLLDAHPEDVLDSAPVRVRFKARDVPE